MKVRLNRKQLDDRSEGFFYLNREPCRVAYVKEGDRKLPEIIFAYTSDLPTQESEPELFAVPHGTASKEEETSLQYKSATVILISKEADDRFREENGAVVSELETLCIEQNQKARLSLI